MTNIFIFNNASRAAEYGIGTYIKQLIGCLRSLPDTKVSLVEMYADTKELSISDDENGICHFLIPSLDSSIENDTYCRIIFYFLARNINPDENDKLIFQFNYFQHFPLAILLKSQFVQSRLVLTVHYMNWCFELNGNIRRLRNITAKGHEPKDDVEKRVVSSYLQEKEFLHLADNVLVLSRRTIEILGEIYGVSANKMHLVYNGIADEACNETTIADSINARRNILYVARLDKTKGLKYLISAYKKVVNKYTDTQLVIAGDGDFQSYLEQSRELKERVTFLGRMKSEDVDKEYQSAFIGVMPSFHEQCSYTVIEMMRHGIPIIGTDSTGLAEMLDATPNLRIHINEDKFDENDFVNQIVSKLDLLLSNDAAYRQASEAVLQQYKQRYTLKTMSRGLRDAILTLQANCPSIVSADYLPYIDGRMMGLINSQPDIDVDFYGIAGIGIYLWWRVLQLESINTTDNANQLALIKEHLIYYLDWLAEIMNDGPLGTTVCDLLVRMKKHGFCPVLIDRIMEHEKIVGESTQFPSEQEILHNALKICVCKI